MRALIFALLCLVFSPLLLVGSAAFAFRVRFVNMPRGISGTAYEPYMARLVLHLIGSRSDEAAERIADRLPALSPVVNALLVRSMALAARWSGYRGAFFAWPGPRPSTLMSFISHRTHFFDTAVTSAARADSPIRQFVFLGAGWDTRAYGSPEGAGLAAAGARIFEIDQPPTQDAKKQALRHAGVPCGHVTFAPTDFNQRSWLESLKDNGFDPALPTFILWEGVTMYLDDAAISRTLADVAGLAPGSRIAFDFMSRELVFAEKPHVLLGRYAKFGGRSFYGESWHFGISTASPARQQVVDFLEGRGLELRGFEALGGTSSRRTPIGGLVLAAVPDGPARDSVPSSAPVHAGSNRRDGAPPRELARGLE